MHVRELARLTPSDPPGHEREELSARFARYPIPSFTTSSVLWISIEIVLTFPSLLDRREVTFQRVDRRSLMRLKTAVHSELTLHEAIGIRKELVLGYFGEDLDPSQEQDVSTRRTGRREVNEHRVDAEGRVDGRVSSAKKKRYQ